MINPLLPLRLVVLELIVTLSSLLLLRPLRLYRRGSSSTNVGAGASGSTFGEVRNAFGGIGAVGALTSES